MCSLGKRVVVTAPNEFLCPVWGVEDTLIPHIQSYYSLSYTLHTVILFCYRVSDDAVIVSEPIVVEPHIMGR